jgi:hypothetical protein
LYAQAGIGILRVDFGWRDIEEVEGMVHAPLRLRQLQIAVRRGFKLMVNFGSFSGPAGWYLRQHPDAEITNQSGLKSYNMLSYWYPELHDILEKKDALVFDFLASNGILKNVTYIVVPFGPAAEPIYPAAWTTTEPSSPMRFWFFDVNARADFPRSMRAKYATLERANAAWGSNYSSWEAVSIPAPGTSTAGLWSDVLDWYRDSKRRFINWQVAHYGRLVARYFPHGRAPELVIAIPGNHLMPYERAQAIAARDGDDAIKAMSDSEFLLDLAHRVGAVTQYTGIPNMSELEYLAAYMRERHYTLRMWGENAGDAGDPQEIDEEVLLNGLYGQDYVGANLFAADHVTPTRQFFDLQNAHRWLADVWRGRINPVSTFKNLLVRRGGCVYADVTHSISLCLRGDANLILQRQGKLVWASGTSRGTADYCAESDAPEGRCIAEYQGDGNFVIYRGHEALWSSKTDNSGVALKLMAESPFLEIVNAGNQVVWAPVLR